MTKVFDMQTQLAIGAKGEDLFHKRYPNLIRLDGRKGDFTNDKGHIIEVKSDSYSMAATPNFFMERYSSMAPERQPGGPHQSLLHNCTYFCYLYVVDGVIYWFKTEELVRWLDAHESTFKTRTVKNKGWTALGYLVPRSAIEHLIYRKERIED